MPAVGDQHRGGPLNVTMPNAPGNVTGNPFEEPQRRINEYTAQEIATLQARLDKKLGPEYISARPGAAGQKVHYLSADKCINLANEVFGFNGWSSSIQNIQIDFVEENQNTGKISLGLSVIVRVTLRDGTFHEDIGYGHIENCKGKAAAFEKSKKEGTTDALKRALRNFGNVLGNCVYDKDYVSKVTKVKTAPAKWDVDELHRHPDFAPAKKPAAQPVQSKPIPEDDDLPPRPSEVGRSSNSNESATFDADGEFGSDLFDEADFGVASNGNPDEIELGPEPIRPQQPPTPYNGPNAQRGPPANHHRPLARPNQAVVTPSKPERPMNPAPGARQIPAPALNNNRPNPLTAQDQYTNQRRPGFPQDQQQNFQRAGMMPPAQTRPSPGPAQPAPGGQIPVKRELGPNINDIKAQEMLPPDSSPSIPSASFFSARAVDLLRDNPQNTTAPPPFDPHAESPSIRKTAGFDHTKSVPISRPMLSNASPSTNNTRDFVNPATDGQRKIGIPGAPGAGAPSPMMNRSQSTSSYRPLTRPNIDPRAAANRASVGPQPGPQNLNGKRPPLNDVTNATHPGGSGPVPPAGGAIDPKRPRFADGSMPPHQQQQQQ